MHLMSEKRLRKVESLLREEIGSMISKQEIKDPRIDPMTAVSHIKVSGDLGYAKVYVSFFGAEETREKTVNALNHAAGFIQRRLGKSLHLRSIPKLVFVADTSIEHGFHMTQKIKDLLD